MVEELQRIAEKALTDSVVRLVWEKTDEETGEPLIWPRASGFFVAPNLIATNIHCITGAASVFAEIVSTKAKFPVEGIVAFDAENDLVIFKVTGEGIPLSLEDSNRVQVGETVCAVGHPRAKAGEATQVTISGIQNSGKRLEIKGEFDPGNSGSAILNDLGKVVGVAVASGMAVSALRSGGWRNSSYAIPAMTLVDLLANVVEVEPFTRANMLKRRKTVKFFGQLVDRTYYRWQELAFKSAKYCALIAILLVAASQIGCLPGGALSNAEKLAADKDYHGAVEAYQSIVDTQPGTPEALQAQLAIGALSIEQMNRPADGIKAYEAVIAAAPKSDEAAEAHYELGMHHYREKDYKAAQTQFDAIVNNFPELELSHNAHLMLAKSYEEAKSFEQAAEAFDNFANRNPRSKRAALALENKARIQRQHLKDEEEAKRTNQMLVKRYGKVEGAQESVEKAKQELRDFNATIPEPDDPLATQQGRALAQFEARRERDRPRGGVERSPAMGNPNVEIPDSGFGISAADVMRNFGGQAGISGDDQGSYHDAELMIANFFYGDESYRDAGALYFDAIARAEAEKAKIDPYTYLKLSICYRKVGMHQRAKEVLRKAASRDGGVVDAVINTGRTHYTSENYEQAIETYNSVVGMSRSKDSEIYWLISLAHKKLGEPEKEREVLERSVAANTQNTDALQSLAEVLHYRLKDRKTAAIFQDLVDQKGDSYIGAKTLGDLTHRYGNYVQARARYRAAARIAKRLFDKSESDVEKRELRNQIVYATILAARATYQLKKPEDAQKIMDELAAEYPEHALIPYGRGELALLNGDTKTAVAEFKAAIEKNPNSDIPIIALGDYYVSQGYNDDAIALWEGFLADNQYNQNVTRSLKKLKGDAEAPKE